MAERDVADGKRKHLPRTPSELLYLRYRKEMGISYSEFLATPYEVVMSDLAILKLQSDVLESKQDANIRKSK